MRGLYGSWQDTSGPGAGEDLGVSCASSALPLLGALPGSLDSWLLSFFIPFRFVCRSLTKRAMLELRASQVRAAEGHHSCTALLWPLHVTGRCFTVA